VLAIKRAIKWISWGLAGLIVLALLGLAVVVWLVDPNSFKPRIESVVRAETGREFSLTGDIDLNFFPWLALRTGAGRFGNPSGFTGESMATWRSAQLGVRLFPLLRGQLIVDRVRLEGADVQLVQKADGTANWQGIAGDEPDTKTDAKTRRLTIDGIDLRDSRVTFIDEATPRRVVITALNLSTDEIAPDEPFTDTEISGNLHMDGFSPEGVPFRLATPKVVLTEDYSKLDIDEFGLEVAGFAGKGAINGSIGEQLTLAGSIDSNMFDLRALLGAVGIEAPKTTDPKALGQVQMTASWQLDGNGMRIDPVSLTLDDTHLKGNFQRAAGEDPVGEFALRGDVLNISRYIPPPDPESEPFVLPTAALKALKFRGLLELEQVTFDDIVMKGVSLRLLLDEHGLRQDRGAAQP
jgi:AsmA protein